MLLPESSGRANSSPLMNWLDTLPARRYSPGVSEMCIRDRPYLGITYLAVTDAQTASQLGVNAYGV